MAGESKVAEDRPAPFVRRLTLRDPATRNALDLAMRAELGAALDAAAADEECRVVILTGDGSTFASGTDVRLIAESDAAAMDRPEVRDIWRTLGAFPKPVVVALNGHAFGGGFELALHGDILLAARGTKVGCPEPKLGLMPGAGATQRLTRAIGPYRAMRMMLTGEAIDAGTAERWGIVAEVTEPAELATRAVALAIAIARLAPLALQAIKRVVRDGDGLPLDAALDLEREAFLGLFATADKHEGVAAFLEKRPPRFTGR